MGRRSLPVRTRLIMVTVIVAFIVGVIVGRALVTAPPAVTPYIVKTAEIHEDHPDWNCRTMGNGQCGLSTTISETLADEMGGALYYWNQ